MDRAGWGQRAGPRFGGHSGSKTPCQRPVHFWRLSRQAPGGEAPREREGALRCLPGSQDSEQREQVLHARLLSESGMAVKAQIQRRAGDPTRMC